MKSLKYAMALITLATPALSEAQYFDHFYLGLGLGTNSYDVSDNAQQFNGNINSIYAIAGVTLNSYIDLETRLGTGLFRDEYGINDQKIKVGLSSMYGFYGKAKLGIFDLVTPYAMLGVTRSTIKPKSNNYGKMSVSETDISYGAGIEFNFFPISVHIEYLNYLDTSQYGLAGFNLNFTTKF